MEHVRKIFLKAKEHWPVVVFVLLTLAFYSSRNSEHSYLKQMRALSPEAPAASPGIFAAFGGGAADHRMSKGLGAKLEAAPEGMSMVAADAAESSSIAPTSGWMPTANASEKAMLIRNGNINAYVDNLKTAKSSLNEKLKKYDARVDAENQSNEYSGLVLSMTIKVPATKFQDLYDDLLNLSDKVNSNSINVDDVTKEYVDVKSRLENKKILQEKFRELAKRTGKVSDILQVEQELARVSEEIDSATKLMKQYETDVSFSTIYLNLTEPKANNGPVATPIGFFKKIGLAFKSGFDWILDTVLEIISLWPMILVFAFGYGYYRRVRKTKK